MPRYPDVIPMISDDLRAHYRRVKSAGAAILSEPQDDPPGLWYRAEDPEGHRWFFFQREGE